MSPRIRPRTLAGVALLLGTAAAATAQVPTAMSCPSVTLKGASGVLGEEHRYSAVGHCALQWKEKKPSLTGDKVINHTVAFDFAGKASWDRDTGVAKESMNLTATQSGSPSGQRVVTGVCTQDPFLMKPPGGTASCHSIQAQAKVSSGPALELLNQQAFWLARHISLTEAQALSQEAAAKQPAQAPPPATVPAPKKQPQGLKDAKAEAGQKAALAGNVLAAMPKPAPLGLEAEAMLAASKSFAHGGALAAQPMTGFGAGWSGGSQLFWSGGQVGSWLDLVVDVPASGSYSLAIYLTKAPDYAQVKVEVDGASALSFDGFSKRVEPSGPVRLGRFDLQAGPRRVRLTIAGKHADSRGLLVGVDRLDLLPVGGS